MQTHVGVAPVAATVVAVSAIAGTIAVRRNRGLPRARRAIVRSLWVLLAMWFLPAAEQAAHAPGNLTLLWRFFVSGSGPGQPIDAAVQAWAEMLAAPLTSGVALAGGSPFDAAASPAALVLAALQVVGLVAVAGWSRRVRSAGLEWLALIALLASLVGLWSVTRIEGRLMDHAIFWLTGIGVVNLATIAAGAGLYVRGKVGDEGALFQGARRAAPLAHGALVTLCVLVAATGLRQVYAGRLPVTLSSPIVGQLGAALRDYVGANGVKRPLVRIGQDVWGTAAGAVLELNRAGIPFAVERSWLPMFPQSYAPGGDEDVEIAVSSRDAHLALGERAGNILVVSSGGVYFDAVPSIRTP
jgi:hypothetical protein